jgi:Protein of unknown function (DUF3689)
MSEGHPASHGNVLSVNPTRSHLNVPRVDDKLEVLSSTFTANVAEVVNSSHVTRNISKTGALWNEIDSMSSIDMKPMIRRSSFGNDCDFVVPEHLAWSFFDISRDLYEVPLPIMLRLGLDNSNFSIIYGKLLSENKPLLTNILRVRNDHNSRAAGRRRSASPEEVRSEEKVDELYPYLMKEIDTHPRSQRRHANQTDRWHRSIDSSEESFRKQRNFLSKLAKYHTTLYFALSGMMSGIRRRQLQDYLCAVGFLPSLTRKIASTNWFLSDLSPLERIHGPDCECREETAETIHLCRILHGTIDRDSLSSVTRWLSRRRLLTTLELRRALESFDVLRKKMNHSCGEEGKEASIVWLDERSVLLELPRNSFIRPVGEWSGKKPYEERLRDLVHWQLPSSLASSYIPGSTVHIVDPIHIGRNGAGEEPPRLVTIDEEVTDADKVPMPDPELLLDTVAHTSFTFEPNREALLSAFLELDSVTAAESWSPGQQPTPTVLIPTSLELKRTDSGLIAFLMKIFVALPRISPYRAWVATCLEAFVRGSPAPVREWVLSHSVLEKLCSFILDEYVEPRYKEILGNSDKDKDEDSKLASPSLSAEMVGDVEPSSRAAPAPTPAPSAAPGLCGDADQKRKEKEMELNHTLQALYDALAECARCSIEAYRRLDKVDERWLRKFHPEVAIEDASASASASASGIKRTPSVLLAFAIDRFADSHLIFRNLCAAESWAYGVCASQNIVYGPSAMSDINGDLSSAQKDHLVASILRSPWSIDSLASQSRTLVYSEEKDAENELNCDKTSTLYPLEMLHLPLLNSNMLRYLRTYRIPILYHTITSISTIEDISHELQPILSLSVQMFTEAHRNYALPALVQELKRYARSRAENDPTILMLPTLKTLFSQKFEPENVFSEKQTMKSGQIAALVAYAKLLTKFWIPLYSLRDRERKSTFSFSGFIYEEVRVVVRALLGLDVTLPPTERIVNDEKGSDVKPEMEKSWTSPYESPKLSKKYWKLCCLL